MTIGGDTEARSRALTDLQSTLLVEAAAGTGKTALIAGRATVMLVRGVEPAKIAAVTFNDLAASEISARIYHYVEELLAGNVPKSLRLAFPNGLSESERATLTRVRSSLDQLTAISIHSFCLRLITNYVVEAGVDPGAQIIDGDQSEAAFRSVVDRWLRRRLNGPDGNDPIAVLAKQDPRRMVEDLGELAEFRLRHRRAATPPSDLSGRLDVQLCEAVREFKVWLDAQPSEPRTRAMCEQLEALARHFEDCFSRPLDFQRLWALVHPPRLTIMRKKSSDLLRPDRKLKSAWERAAGKSKGAAAHATMLERFEHVDRAYRSIIGKLSTAIVAELSEPLEAMLAEYAGFKRAAAVLDFDDLIEKARDLLAGNERVCEAIGERYAHILIDEFQDTDAVQCEILFGIAAQTHAHVWSDHTLRPGALFMVGDPKQAIYRFRGASVETYVRAKRAIEGQATGAVLKLTDNFRSRPAILDYVNGCFDGPLSKADQPGYVALTPTLCAPEPPRPCVARLPVGVMADADVLSVRKAEADAVADLCHRLIGSFEYEDARGRVRRLAPGGIALLTPGRTSLEIYESAFEAYGLPFASQAGKGFYRRQEVQDLLALTRVLSDPSDSAAFGALMRGPLVGLTEQELLDITLALRGGNAAGSEQFTVRTDPQRVAHEVARQVLETLQDLRRRSWKTTPALILGEAVERLLVVPILTSREARRSPQAVANVEAVIRYAKGFDVRGLRALAQEMNEGWAAQTAVVEGRADADEAVSVVSIHSAKGMEWPVVIPINTVSQFRRPSPHVYRETDQTVHWLIGDVVSPELEDALQRDGVGVSLERERLLYVGCTRARELLVIPDFGTARANTWAGVIGLPLAELPVLSLPASRSRYAGAAEDVKNEQTRAGFEAEQAAIDRASIPLSWWRASDRDPERQPLVEVATHDGEVVVSLPPVGAGRVRGLVLHKLIEEVLNGEVIEKVDALTKRSAVLAAQLSTGSDSTAAPNPYEMATTVIRTLAIPEVAALRPSLVAEIPVYAMASNDGAGRQAMAGRIDALAMKEGEPPIPIDWKSDIAPTVDAVREHSRQLEDYLRALGAPRGLLVYMTSGHALWVSS